MTAPRLVNLRLQDWRCHGRLELEPSGQSWVVLAGDNGSGKTSILEGIYAAARGRSFRTPVLAHVIAAGGEEARAVLRSEGDVAHVLGVGVRRSGRELHLDGAAGVSLAEAAQALPAEYISGDAYQLVSGPPGARRRFLDWVLFHVEPPFFALWRAWHRAHRQRNALLRSGSPDRNLNHWLSAVAEPGERLSGLRAALVGRLNEILAEGAAIPRLGRVQLVFRTGWGDTTLAAALERTAARERQAGRAVVGPQYDDWSVEAGGLPPVRLSRGQAKLVTFLLYRAQTRLLCEAGHPPLLLVDDLAADLDPDAIRIATGLLGGEGAQIWVSVLAREASLALSGEAARFHVEPGRAVRA